MRVGFIGLGTMGGKMAASLQRAGYSLMVYDTRREAAAPHLAAGAVWADSPRKVAQACDVVFTMVSTTDDLKQVLFAADGLVAGANKPKVVVDSSSISQEGSAEIRTRLEAMGVAYLCTPVSGNAKMLAWASLGCWFGAIVAGRLLAYVK